MGTRNQNGGHQVPGSSGLQWLHWSPLPLPSLCSASVQQLVSLHGGYLLPTHPNPHPHSQEAQRGLRQQPLQGAGLVPHHRHCDLCFCPSHSSGQSPVTIVTPDPTPGPTELSTTTMGTMGNTTTTVIEGGACGMVLTANIVMFLTIMGFF